MQKELAGDGALGMASDNACPISEPDEKIACAA
jgi:hypothetical protein